tara:strand:+ start:929 stop:1399 length:471 start_codon:yes stop_codon:yes gene_type:complete
VDDKKLLKYAVDYLSKYDSSKKNLTYVLKKKILRLQITNLEKAKLIDTIDNIIFKLEKNNFIDDNKFSMSKIISLSRTGKSEIYIKNYLIKKGINKFDIQNNFKIFQGNNNNWELNSAKLFAKKKRLLESNENYEKKLAKMARAGFSYEVCKKILG